MMRLVSFLYFNGIKDVRKVIRKGLFHSWFWCFNNFFNQQVNG